MRWAGDGRLPSLATLLDQGAVAEMDPQTGMLGGALWPSFATALNPGRHGRYFWSQLTTTGYSEATVEPASIAGVPFWRHLAGHGSRVAIIDVPKCAPSLAFDGLEILDWTAHEPSLKPANLHGLAEERRRALQAVPQDNCDAMPDTPAAYAQLGRRLDHAIAAKERLCVDLLAEPWDFFGVVFTEAHCIGHQCWHLADPSHPRHPSHSSDDHPLLDIYVRLDQALGRILERANPDRVMILCNLGMGPLYAEPFVFDEVLRRLDAVRSGNPSKPSASRYGRLKRVWYRLPSWARPNRVQYFLRGHLAPVLQRTLLAQERARCRWFMLPSSPNYGAVRINLAGRETSGRVAAADYDATCEFLAARLLEITDHEGRPVVESVVRADSFLHGPNLQRMPDLFVRWKRDRRPDSLGSPAIGRIPLPAIRGRTGDHRGNGLVIVKGPEVEAGPLDKFVRYEDLAPTLAQWCGVSLPDVDGAPVDPWRAP